MPLYMDRHDGENLTPEAVAEAHAKDIKVQDKYDVKFITYWYDDERDSVFCLVHAHYVQKHRELKIPRW